MWHRGLPASLPFQPAACAHKTDLCARYCQPASVCAITCHQFSVFLPVFCHFFANLHPIYCQSLCVWLCVCVTYQPFSSRFLQLSVTVQPFLFFCNSSAAFDFRAVCIGCPEDGTPEAESAQTVAQYVVSFLINIQAAQKVRGERKRLSAVVVFSSPRSQ